MSASMPKPFNGFYGPNDPSAKGEDFYGFVNPQPVRLVGADQRELLNQHMSNKLRGHANAVDGQSGRMTGGNTQP